MTTNPLDVQCGHCGAAPGSRCLTPEWPGKGQRSRTVLRFSDAHPQRVAYAAVLAAGAADDEARRAAWAAVTAGQEHTGVPYLGVATAAVAAAARRTVGRYTAATSEELPR